MTLSIFKKFLIAIILLTLGSLILFGCLKKNSSTTIEFTPRYGSTPLNCQINFQHTDNQKTDVSNEKSWKYQQLQFFIHNVEVKTKQNNWQPWLMTTNAYQSDNIALIGEVCGEVNKSNHWQLELTALAQPEEITDIRFTLGVPFSLNHLNPLTQPSPLNISSMFWGWRGGHKFMRIELISEYNDWLFHLGSTGCKAPSPVRAPKTGCLQPNRVVVSLPFSQSTTTIEFNLAALLYGLELKQETSCQSAFDEEACKVLFVNLGLNGLSNNEQLLFTPQINE